MKSKSYEIVNATQSNVVKVLKILGFVFIFCGLPLVTTAEIQRLDFQVPSEPGTELGIREVVDHSKTPVGDPVILLHGARVSGIPSFDLLVEGGSLAADLAKTGIAVYIVDLRGYGNSTRPKEMEAPRKSTPPLVRSGTAVRDIAAAVDAILSRTGAKEVALLGWATGGHWAGYYATIAPGKVSKLVFYNTLYGYTVDHKVIGRNSRVADPNNRDRFNLKRFRNYRLNTADSLTPSWDRFIPIENKNLWRDPEVLSAYIEAAMTSDPSSGNRNPPSFRAPSGAMADSFLLATGAALWDARLTDADALIIRSGNDFWSRPSDVTKLRDHLNSRPISAVVQTLYIPQATHYVHLDRPERGRDLFLNAVVKFLLDK